ncbi:MAG: toll/interleukin-1 receptor domain-containing protein [Planctomycetes bacterium]|nr:toll/interleukin-1 receptor domain-containing protein [Planctomycetota bacterium]
MLLHLGSLRAVTDRQRKGLVTDAAADVERRRISLAVLELLDELPEMVRARAETEQGTDAAAAPPSTGAEPFDLFLAHHSGDKPIVRQLAAALQQRGVRVWLDEEQLAGGSVWQQELDRILGEVRAAAILVGPQGLGPWEVPEMLVCIDEFVRRRMTVIPILLPGLAEPPELPRFLRQFTWVDLSAGLCDTALDRLAARLVAHRGK